MESVYLETSFISYLASRPSRDLLVAAHQQITHDWWIDRRGQFECCISQIVLDEISAGNPEEAAKRLAIVNDLRVLEIDQATESVIRAIVTGGLIPSRAIRDVAHIAVAAMNETNYFLTWNCAHLANAQIRRRLSEVLGKEGYSAPLICTPEELMGG